MTAEPVLHRLDARLRSGSGRASLLACLLVLAITSVGIAMDRGADRGTPTHGIASLCIIVHSLHAPPPVSVQPAPVRTAAGWRQVSRVPQRLSFFHTPNALPRAPPPRPTA